MEARERMIPHSGDDWIGVDLNTTGHVAVAAHPASGGVVMLGDLSGSTGDRERASQNQKIAKEIVKMARQLWCGIKLEDLTGAGFAGQKKRNAPLAFSRREGSFYHLQKLIEKRAEGAGVRLVYVDPASTSRCCSRCGRPGIRKGKRFSCPACGHAGDADANAAFNIASAPARRAS
ncbi:MAG: IS200/IS605 family element transposase accessory protein TnpB [Methanomicrobiales archaeon]|nr:IS200/IS605 family element transposase accessory protein TnpB [Methanomicrobiales archaeon]